MANLRDAVMDCLHLRAVLVDMTDFIAAMAKRKITLVEVKRLIEEGQHLAKEESHGWISHRFESRQDNLICAAEVTDEAIIVKTVMVNWKKRDKP